MKRQKDLRKSTSTEDLLQEIHFFNSFSLERLIIVLRMETFLKVAEKRTLDQMFAMMDGPDNNLQLCTKHPLIQ